MADNFLIVNPDKGTTRTTGDAGSATVLEPSKDGKSVPLGADSTGDWKPWAFTAGGGALAYMLAKYLLDDDDDRKKGKKSWFKSVLPYLAAVGGALGGHALSQPARGKNGAKGEYAFRIGEDGNIVDPGDKNAPSDGTAAYSVAGAAGGASFLTGARNRYKHRWNKINEAEELAKILKNYKDMPEIVERSWLPKQVVSDAIRKYNISEGEGKKYLERLANLASKKYPGSGLSRAMIKNILGRGGKLGRAGSWASFIIPTAIAPVAGAIGWHQDNEYSDWMKARRMAGFE